MNYSKFEIVALEFSAQDSHFRAPQVIHRRVFRFWKQLFETTFLLRTGELARALLLYYTQEIISTTKNAGVLARAPNTSCFYQLS